MCVCVCGGVHAGGKGVALRMLIAASYRSQVEKLLAGVAAATTAPSAEGAAGGAADLDTRARLLERVAGEVSRLAFQANRGKVRRGEV